MISRHSRHRCVNFYTGNGFNNSFNDYSTNVRNSKQCRLIYVTLIFESESMLIFIFDPCIIYNIFILFYIEEEVFLWLNSDEKKLNLLQRLKTTQKNDSVAIEKSLEAKLSSSNNCLGVIINRKGENASLVSRMCNDEKQFLCSLDVFRYKPPVRFARFPCIPPRNASDSFGANKDKREVREEKGKEIGN